MQQLVFFCSAMAERLELEPPALRAETGTAERWNRILVQLWIHLWGSGGKVGNGGGQAMDGIDEISAGCGELCVDIGRRE